MGELYGKLYGYDNYPNELINYLLNNATTEELFEHVWATQVQMGKKMLTETQTSGGADCLYRGGEHICSPDGGWLKYYPLTDEDREWLVEAGIEATLLPLGFGVGRVLGGGIKSVAVNFMVKQIARPIIRCELSSSCNEPFSELHTVRFVNELDAAPVQGTTQSLNGYNSSNGVPWFQLNSGNKPVFFRDPRW